VYDLQTTLPPEFRLQHYGRRTPRRVAAPVPPMLALIFASACAVIPPAVAGQRQQRAAHRATFHNVTLRAGWISRYNATKPFCSLTSATIPFRSKRKRSINNHE
jgi:hypothetical protein